MMMPKAQRNTMCKWRLATVLSVSKAVAQWRAPILDGTLALCVGDHLSLQFGDYGHDVRHNYEAGITPHTSPGKA